VRIVKRKQKGLSSAFIASQFNVSKRRIEQIWKYFKDNGSYMPLNKQGRKPYRKENKNLNVKILNLKKKHKFGATYIAKLLRDKHNIKISNNYVHNLLLVNNMALENKNKKKRRKPWIRYERKHSLSAVHMDWHYNSNLNKWMCAVQDDASRKILTGGEYDNALGDYCIDMLEKAYQENLHISPIREVITDHGPQFYANKKDKHGEGESKFQIYCKERGIKHILCKYKHPQTNGKFEKWNHTYELYRKDFNDFDSFIEWYNNRPHGSLDMNSPEWAFWYKVQDIILGRFYKWAEI
jgi:putative transposase